MAEFVRLEIDGAVGVIRLDRPPVNAFNSAVQRQLLQVAGQVAENPAIRAVVLYGGERAFAAGADIKEMVDLNPGEIASLDGHLTDAVNAIARLPQPVIAAISGYALGGGFELALAADLRVVAENAVLGLPEITLGVIPGAGGTQRLPRLIGAEQGQGTDLLRASVLAVSRPWRWVWPPGRYRRSGCFPKRCRWRGRWRPGRRRRWRRPSGRSTTGWTLSLHAGLELESQRFAELFATEDQKIGMTSFVQHGPGKAKFVGR